MDNLDREDWRRFCKGDVTAMERIYNRHKDRMYTYCLYVTGNRQVSEDVVQETFVRLMRQKAGLNIETTLKNWLFICARNLTFNHLKKQSRDVSPVSIVNPVTEMDMETRLFIRNVLGRLKPEERELILLREQQRFSVEELSALLEISEEAVRVRLYRVRKKMQQIAKEKK